MTPSTISWYSSYEQNNYGSLFYDLVRTYKPKRIVELGTLAGYSAYHMARGLRDNGQGTLDCYDLWENYENNQTFYSFPKSVAKENLKEFGDIVNLHSRDAIGVENLYSTVDILHVDIENDGRVLDKIIYPWITKISQLIIIEGGSKERDTFPWMLEMHKKPIFEWLCKFAKNNKDIEYFTIEPFPSITLIRKK